MRGTGRQAVHDKHHDGGSPAAPLGRHSDDAVSPKQTAWEQTHLVHDPQDDLDLALEMADRADAMTLADFTGSELVFADKADGTPVTETDRVVEEVLRALLAERRPGDGFLGEETGASGSATRQWIIDPIDGTRSFVSGGRAWGTQIALQDGDRLVVGVASAPALGARWWALRHTEAFRQERHEPGARRLQVTDLSELSAATWTCHPPLEVITGDWRVLADRLSTACGRRLPVTSHGALMVAEGELDICLQLEGQPWDYAGFAAVVQGAGGHFSYLDASTRMSGVRPALFTNGKLHSAALAALAARP